MISAVLPMHKFLLGFMLALMLFIGNSSGTCDVVGVRYRQLWRAPQESQTIEVNTDDTLMILQETTAWNMRLEVYREDGQVAAVSGGSAQIVLEKADGSETQSWWNDFTTPSEILLSNVSFPSAGTWSISVPKLRTATWSLNLTTPWSSGSFFVTTKDVSPFPTLVRFNTIQQERKWYDGGTACASLTAPLAPITVQVLDSAMSPLSASSPPTEVIAYIVDKRTKTTYDVANGKAIVREGLAVFEGIRPLVAAGTDTALRFRLNVSSDTMNVTSPSINLKLNRVAVPDCTLSFSNSTPGIVQPTSESGKEEMMISTNVALPPITVEVLNSNGLNEWNADVVCFATAYEVGTPRTKQQTSELLLNDFVMISNGVGVFDNLMFTALTATVKRYVIEFSVSSSQGTLPISTTEISVIPVEQARAMITFDPRNEWISDEHTVFPATVGSFLAPVSIQMLTTRMNLDTSSSTSAVTIAVTCNEAPMNGSTSQTMIRGIATFSDLMFTSSPQTETTVRLTFTATSTISAAANKMKIVSGTGRLFREKTTGAVVRFAKTSFVKPYNTMLWAQAASPLPVVHLQVCDSTGAVDRTNDEISISVRSSWTELEGSFAVSNRGEIFFPSLQIVDNVGSLRLRFTVGSEGNKPAGGTTLVSPRVNVLDSNEPQQTASLSFLRGYSGFGEDQLVEVAHNTQLPTIVIAAMSSKHVRTTPTSSLSVVASGFGPSSITVRVPLDSSGVATFQQGTATALRYTLPLGKGKISFCLEPKVAIWSCIYQDVIVVPTLSSIKKRFYVSAIPTLQSEGTFSATAYSVAGIARPDKPHDTDVTLDATAELASAELSSLRQVIVQGNATFSELSFSNPKELLRDAPVLLTFTSELVRGVSNPAFVNPSPPLPTTTTTLIVELSAPRGSFSASLWKSKLATFLQTEPRRIVIVDYGLSEFDGRSWIGERVQIRFTEPYSDSVAKRSVEDLNKIMLNYKPTAMTHDLGIVSVTTSDNMKLCDKGYFRDRVESARHCEAFKGRDARCDCFEGMMATFGSICQNDQLMYAVCSHLAQCVSHEITSICEQVSSSLALRVFLIVAGTLGCLGFLVGCWLLYKKRHRKIQRKITLSTRSDHAKAKRRQHDEVFLMS